MEESSIYVDGPATARPGSRVRGGDVNVRKRGTYREKRKEGNEVIRERMTKVEREEKEILPRLLG